MAVKHITLKEWISDLGINEVAGLLRVERSGVRHWVAGKVLPTQSIMFKIRVLSKGLVDFNRTIDEHFSPSNKKRIQSSTSEK